jgi:hypothetical protein
MGSTKIFVRAVALYMCYSICTAIVDAQYSRRRLLKISYVYRSGVGECRNTKYSETVSAGSRSSFR